MQTISQSVAAAMDGLFTLERIWHHEVLVCCLAPSASGCCLYFIPLQFLELISRWPAYVHRIREHPCLEHSADSIDPKTGRLSDRRAAAMNDVCEVVVTVTTSPLTRLAGEALLGLEVPELRIRCLYRVSS